MKRLLVFCYFCPTESEKLGGVQQIVDPLLDALETTKDWEISVVHREQCSMDNHYHLPEEDIEVRAKTINPDTAVEAAESFQSLAAQHHIVLSIDKILPAPVSVPCVLMSNTLGYEMQATAIRSDLWSQIIVPTQFHQSSVARVNRNTTVSVIQYGLPQYHLKQAQAIGPADWTEDSLTVRLPHRPDPRKGHREAIEGLAKAMPEADNIELQLAWFDEQNSTSTYRSKLEQLAGDLGVADHLTFSPWLAGADKWDALAQCSGVLALGEFKETFGLAITEAVLSGRPVVARPQPASREVVGKTKLLQELEEPTEWFSALDDYYMNRSLETEARIRDRVTKQLSLDRMVSSYDRLLTNTITQSEE